MSGTPVTDGKGEMVFWLVTFTNFGKHNLLCLSTFYALDNFSFGHDLYFDLFI